MIQLALQKKKMIIKKYFSDLNLYQHITTQRFNYLVKLLNWQIYLSNSVNVYTAWIMLQMQWIIARIITSLKITPICNTWYNSWYDNITVTFCNKLNVKFVIEWEKNNEILMVYMRTSVHFKFLSTIEIHLLFYNNRNYF